MDHLYLCNRIAECGTIPLNQTTLRKLTTDPVILCKLITEWIIDRRHSFNEVEAESFCKIIAYIDATTENKLPKPGKTI